MRDLATTVGFVLALAANTASAGTVTYTVSKPAATLPTSTIVDVPQFDRAIGRLESVSCNAWVTVSGTMFFENTAPTPLLGSQGCAGRFYPNASVQAGGGGASWSIQDANEDGVCLPPLAAFDGVLDHAGPSGAAVTFLPHYGGGAALGFYMAGGSWSASSLDAFTGYSTTPISVTVLANHAASELPPGDVTFTTFAALTVSTTYTYSPYPGSICNPGAGGAQWCPCGMPAGVACPNSTGASASLTSSSTPSISSQSFALHVTGVAPGAPCLFFQGSSSTHTGSQFGDGRICVSGNIVRLGVKFAANGTAAFPEVSIDPPLAVAGQIPGPGAYSSYQVWYRDSAAFCTPATFNLSNGVAAMWNP